MTPKLLLVALVDVVRVLRERQEPLVLTPRSVAVHCGWTSESLVAAMKLASLTWDQVLQVAQGYPRRVVARVAGRQGLYDAPPLEDEPGSELAQRIAQTLRPSLCASQPCLRAQIQARTVAVPLVLPRAYTPRPIPPRRRRKKQEARGFKELLTHSLLESRQERASRAEEALHWMAQEEEAQLASAPKEAPGRKGRKLSAPQRFVQMVQRNLGKLAQGTFLAVDVETTDNSTEHGRVIELGAVAFVGWKEVGQWCWRFDPQGRRIGRQAFRVHGIRDAELEGQPLFGDKARFIHQLMHRAGVVVAHNLPYDKRMITQELLRAELAWPQVLEICTKAASETAEPGRTSHKLDSMCAQYQVELLNHHAAEDDARACGLLWRHLYNTLTGQEAQSQAREAA